ncbi:MAG: flagellin [Alphaproteobacteria bacterium]|nr:flagellin [Alphaproteobacteria bacterium]
MAIDKINLTGGVRSNLLSLQRTTNLIEIVQTRLSTGLKVNTAIDDASAFFTSRALSNRADDLSNLKENIDLAVSALQTAITGIESITELVEQAKGLANNAKATGDTSERSSLALQFDQLLGQIDDLANDSSFNGTNLIRATPDNLEVDFNEDGSSDITIIGLDSTTGAAGINVSASGNNFLNTTDINASITQLNSALSSLRTNAATIGSNNTILQSRLNFTQELSNTLEEGAAKLTLADLNEESANLLALQTRQQLGLNSLSLAAQSERAILNLFS